MKDWYKNAVIYELDVETFLDANNDGVGDFEGLTLRLDYLANVGMTCLWLLPIYPTPNRDNGYDIMDYYAIDPRLGTPGDFVDFLKAAEERSLRVLLDISFDHTSNEHPWFKAACSSRDSKYHDYYIWLDEPPEDDDEPKIFGDRQDSLWTYVPEVKQYYHHTFYDFEPDLNLTNPDVRREMRKIMGYWLELGIAGFRVDAVPHMLRDKGNAHFEGDPLDVLNEMRAFVTDRRPDAVLLGEVDAEPQQYANFVGHGGRLHMLFNFFLDNYLFLAFATSRADDIRQALRALPPLPETAQWATFLRNHDELDLERLSKNERQTVDEAFAPKKNMRAFGRGIRRRLAPMLGGDQRRIQLALSLLFSLPGTPVVHYGEEIGMGENLSLDERASVRTPMQWTAACNAGFSNAPPDQLVRPVIRKGDFSYKKVNVRDEQRDPNSLLNMVRRMTATRKECPEFGLGDYDLLDFDDPAVFAHVSRHDGGLAAAIHNLADHETTVTFKLNDQDMEDLVEVLGDQHYKAFDPESGKLHLGPYGFRWFRKGAPRY